MPRTHESPPADLDAESQRLWKRTIEQLKGQSTWETSDVPALDRYIRSVERARLARAERGGKLTAEGSQGQIVQHPSLKTEREAERDARDYAQDLLLTSAARKRHEIEADSGSGDPLEGALA